MIAGACRTLRSPLASFFFGCPCSGLMIPCCATFSASIHVYTYIPTCMCHACMYVCNIHVYIHIYMHVYACACMHGSMHLGFAHTCTYVYMVCMVRRRICVCVYMGVLQAQSLSTQQRIMSFGTQRATDETMINDNRSSSTALLRNISEAESLKNRCVCL